MQLYPLLALVSLAVATPARRQEGFPGTNSTQSGSCTRFSAPRQCGIGGDRVLTCIDYERICGVGWTSPSNVTDIAANKQSCEGKTYGDACNAVWTCCPPSS